MTEGLPPQGSQHGDTLRGGGGSTFAPRRCDLVSLKAIILISLFHHFYKVVCLANMYVSVTVNGVYLQPVQPGANELVHLCHDK